MITNLDKARILSEALPYIQKFHGKTVVVKYGGNAMLNEELKRAVISDIVLLSLVGIKVVVVHGGGPEINDLLGRLGKESRFVDGLRYTDDETMEVVQMVLCGKVGKELAVLFSRTGGRAISLSGLDGDLFVAERLIGENDYGLVGDIKTVDPLPVQHALEGGFIPVVSTVARSANSDAVYNINADTAAAKLAVALGAAKLVLLTDVCGIMRDQKDESSLIHVVRLNDIPKLMKTGVIKGGMIPKVECCAEAVQGGVERTHILDGRVHHSILIEMLSDKGIGTMIL